MQNLAVVNSRKLSCGWGRWGIVFFRWPEVVKWNATPGGPILVKSLSRWARADYVRARRVRFTRNRAYE